MTQQSLESGFSPVSIEKSREIALDPPRPVAFDEREWTRFKREAQDKSRQWVFLFLFVRLFVAFFFSRLFVYVIDSRENSMTSPGTEVATFFFFFGTMRLFLDLTWRIGLVD
jgi:hypothetical protein